MFRLVGPGWDDRPVGSCQKTSSHKSDDILQVIDHDGDDDHHPISQMIFFRLLVIMVFFFIVLMADQHIKVGLALGVHTRHLKYSY